MSVPVIAAPIMPTDTPLRMTAPAGATIAEIVRLALPELDERDLDLVRVVVATDTSSSVVDRSLWRIARPKAGVHVVIRVLPGKDSLRSILMIVVAVAAVALGQLWAPAFVNAFGGTTALWSGIIGIGVSAIGQLLINALVPLPTAKSNSGADDSKIYTIDGFKNRLEPDGVVPDLIGTMRFAPRFAARSYTEIVGDIQYQRCLFLVSYGGDYGVEISDPRIGDTSIDAYTDLELEIREGLAGDAPVTLFPTQVVEKQIGTELTRPKPRDASGNVIAGASIETPVIRSTGRAATGASIILAFPQGLAVVDGSGNRSSMTVQVRIRQRLAGTSEWTPVTTLTLSAAKLDAVYRQYTWDFPTRGLWEIEATRMTDESTSTQVQSRSYWAALQTLRPEYPLNFPHPISVIAARIRATYQLNGSLDDFSVVASKRMLDWDAGTSTWVARMSSNPASAFRHRLQCAANPRPVPDSGIDLEALADWHEFCVAKGLKYDRLSDESKPLREWLIEIAAAGRASPRHDGRRWTIAIDRPQTLVVDHISPRNSWGFKARRSYFEPPHGFRIAFPDATNDYKDAERLVPWPGHTGPITLTEQLALPGKTDPDEIWIEARRRMYEAIHRPDTFDVNQAGAARVATRGDLVALSHDVLDHTQAAARIKSVEGRVVVLDDVVTMEAGTDYAIRFRAGLSEADTIGWSAVVPVATVPGEARSVVMTAAPPEAPTVGQIVHFGRKATQSLMAKIVREEAGDKMSGAIRLADAAPVIDDLVDAEDPPAWSGIAGDETSGSGDAPAVPVFVDISSGAAATGATGRIIALLSAGSGTTPAAQFQVEHRLSSSSTWTVVTVPTADGGATINGYATGNTVNLRAAAISGDGVMSAYTATVTLTVAA